LEALGSGVVLTRYRSQRVFNTPQGSAVFQILDVKVKENVA